MKANLLTKDLNPLTQNQINDTLENGTHHSTAAHNIIHNPLEEYADKLKVLGCTSKDLKLDIILKAQVHPKTGSITGRLYETFMQPHFDKDFTASKRSGRKKETIIQAAKTIKTLEVPNKFKAKLYTFNLHSYKSFKVLKKLSIIDSTECNYCTMDLDQEHIQYDCVIASYILNVLKLDIETKFQKTTDIKFENVFDLELTQRQKQLFTNREQKEIINAIAAIRVGIHNFFYETKFKISKHDQHKLLKLYNKMINTLKITYKTPMILGKIKMTPKRYPISNENFPTLNALTKSYETTGCRYTLATNVIITSTDNQKDKRLYSALGYTDQFLTQANLLKKLEAH